MEGGKPEKTSKKNPRSTGNQLETLTHIRHRARRDYSNLGRIVERRRNPLSATTPPVVQENYEINVE